MAITYNHTRRHQNMTEIKVTSDLSGTIYVHGYVDGSWIGRVVANADKTATFFVAMEDGDQAEFVAQDTTDDAYDPISNAPIGYPARRTVWWTASTSSDIAFYRVQFGTGQSLPGAWTDLGDVWDDGKWSYVFISQRLVDLTWYWFRIVPYDKAGNAGTVKTIGPEFVVRRPDAPDFTTAFNDGTQKVTYSAA